MPVAVRPRQPAHLQAEDQADVVQRHLGQEALEAGPPLDRLAAPAEVVIDGGDAIGRPSEGDRPTRQRILACGGLLVVAHLLGCGLADVDECRAVEVPGPELGGAEWVQSWPASAARVAVWSLIQESGRAGRGAPAAGRPGACAQTAGVVAGCGDAVVRCGGGRCVGRWRAWALSGCLDAVLLAPRGQFEQRGDADRNRPRGACTTCHLRCSLLGPSQFRFNSGLYAGR